MDYCPNGAVISEVSPRSRVAAASPKSSISSLKAWIQEVVDPLPAGLESLTPALALLLDRADESEGRGGDVVIAE